jgi:energy-coupling factor transporter ATP-binding protein EcfA2
VSAQPRYDEPFYWWGPSGVSPIELSIGDLLRDGTIDPGSAAVLWAALARRSSLAVIAGPSGAGKTTLLSALLEFLPPGMRRLYLRGCFETFAFLDDPSAAPATTALLVNEISPHLPVYLWGAAVERYLRAAEDGFALLATAHAKSVPEFVSMLTGSPLRIPAARVAAFRYIVVLEQAVDAPSGRRVSGVWRLAPTRSGVGMQPVPWQPSRAMTDEPRDASPTTVACHFPERELPWRSRVLERLRDGELARLPEERWPPATVGAGHGP